MGTPRQGPHPRAGLHYYLAVEEFRKESMHIDGQCRWEGSDGGPLIGYSGPLIGDRY